MSNSHSTEIWRSIPGYGGHYEASSEGRIRVKDRVIVKKHPMTGKMTENKYKGRLLKPCVSDKWGHTSVTLGVDGINYSSSVHKLVLMAFVGARPHGMEACHNNGIANDNRISNLRWDTHYENNQDRKKHGKYAVGQNHPMAKLSNEIVRQIKASGLNGPQVAEKYGIGTSTAHRIITGRSWTHVV